MTFINPAILWGMAAISIPILIHLFNLRKTRKLEFSTLMFLKEIQQSRYKKIKLKQLLILLCRIAMIILLVLAFARPFEIGYLGIAGEKARSSVLLILDDSYSMEARDVNGSYFENAKKKINETIDLLNDNDEVYFTTVSGIDYTKGKLIYKDLKELKDAIAKIKISDVTKELNEVLYYANKILESSSNPYREIFLFTDGQKNFLSNSGTIATDFKTDERTKFNIILTGNRKGNNISLDTVDIATKIFEKNKNIKLRCTLHNRNDFDVQNQSVVLNFKGKKDIHDEKVIDIPANSSVEVEFNFMPDVTGFAEGNVELPVDALSNDELPDDNRRYFVVKIPEKVSVLLVSHATSDPDYIKMALTSSEELMKDSLNSSRKYFDLKQTIDNDISYEDFSKYDCILFVNKSSFTESETDKLFNYIQNGGGVIIFPGRDMSIDNYNKVFLHKLDLPSINSSFTANTGQGFKFDKLDFQHPLLEDLFKVTKPTTESYSGESPQITHGIDLLTEKNSQAVIKLNSSKNFLVEYLSGKGHILFYAVSPDLTDSDFPKNNLFPILVVRSILYLSNNNPIKETTTGKDYFLDISNFILNPEKDSLILLSTASPGNVRINYQPNTLLEIPGDDLAYNSVYKLSNNNELLFEFPCSFDKKESDLEKLNPAEIANLLESTYHTSVNIISANNEINASITALRTGSELWQIFLIAALLFLAVEFYISKSITNKNKIINMEG
jgi:hypothetical protein